MNMRPAIFLPVLLLAGSTFANESVLLQRIIELEKRVAELEQKLAPVLEEERIKEVVKQQRETARIRMLLDAEIYSRDELNAIEKAYHIANNDWKAAEAGNAVKYLVEKFPRANRTGCAVLSRAQSVEGEEQLDLLKQAVTQFGGCYYSNGVNVGAYARLYLGMRYKRDGEEDEKAAKLFSDLRKNHPDAIDHKGQLLTAHLDEMELKP